jgi:branched-chain amino acid transport system substrate-binding protein
MRRNREDEGFSGIHWVDPGGDLLHTAAASNGCKRHGQLPQAFFGFGLENNKARMKYTNGIGCPSGDGCIPEAMIHIMHEAGGGPGGIPSFENERRAYINHKLRRLFMKGNRFSVKRVGFALVGTTVCFCLTVFLLISTAGADQVIKIGYLSPQSGTAAAPIGQDMTKGTRLAIEHINKSGGIKSMGGAKLALLEADTNGDPKVGMTEAERLITVEKVPVIIGAYQSSVTYPSTSVAEKYQVPWVVDLAAKADITERGFKYVFRPVQIPSSGNADSVVDYVKWISEKTGKKPKTVAIVAENTDWGQDLAKTLRNRFPSEMGLEIVLDESYPPNSPNLRPLVVKLKGKNPDLISVTSYTADAIQLHKLLAQIQVNAMGIIGSAAGQADRTFVPSVGIEATNYIYTTNGWAGYNSCITTPFAKTFWDDFKAEYNYDPTEFTVCAYGAVWVLKDALERAGKADRASIREALAKTDIRNTDLTKLLGFDVVIDAKGQNPYKRFVMQQIYEGKYFTVWPANVAAKDFKPVWPVPKWSQR